MFLLLQWSVDRGFLRYVNTIEQERLESLASGLEHTYAEQGNWNVVRSDPWRWLRQAANREAEPLEPPARHSGRSARWRETDGHGPPPHRGRLLLLDADRQPIFGPARRATETTLRPLQVDGAVVGYLGLLPRERLTESHELRFVEQQKLAIAVLGVFVFLVSAGLALPLANRLLRPIRALAAATHRLAAGHYASRVRIDSADELGQLATDFNALAHTLDKTEQARRQWLADVSHELRTPLAVLRGEIEAIEDGIRQPTPAAIHSLHAEVLQLGRLVDDLHQLALSDVGALSYRKEGVDLRELLDDLLAGYRPEIERRGLALAAELPGRPIAVFADGERLRQMFANLLDNALHYTDAGGRIAVRLHGLEEMAVVDILDSAPGMPENEMARLFERFYRVEGSRNRRTGGAGLGLAICRNIAEAHGGRLSARPSPLGGLWLQVALPEQKEGR